MAGHRAHRRDGVDRTRFPTSGYLCVWLEWGRPVMSGPGSVIRSEREKANLAAAPSSRSQGASRTKCKPTSPPSTPGSSDGEGPTKPGSPLHPQFLDVSWHLLANGILYDDPGARFFELQHDPAVEGKRLQPRMEALGFEVSIAPATA